MSDTPKKFTIDDARRIGKQIGIDWTTSPFDPEQFQLGLAVDLEHGSRDPETNVTGDDEVTTGKIAWAHLKEIAGYYTRLYAMEAAADAEAAGQPPVH